MRKLIFILIVEFIIGTTGFSQISQITAKKLLNQNKDLTQKIKEYSKLDANFEVVAKVCVENWNLDSLNNLINNGEGTMTFEKLDGDRIKLTQNMTVTVENGNLQQFVGEIYFRSSPDFYGENSESDIDSTILYIVQGGIKIPFAWERYNYENGKLINSATYINFGLWGSPLGIALSDSTNLYYDNKDFLIAESSYSLFPGDTSVTIYDSIIYTNNAKGLKTESIYYSIDNDKNLALSNRYTYEYDSQDRVIKEEDYVNPDSWTLQKRSTTDYQPKLIVNIHESTDDAGTTWEPTKMDSTYFTIKLPYNISNRQSSSEYKEGEWKITEISLYKDCSETSTNNIENLSFISRFDNDDIVITADQMINNANITLYNTNGQVVFNQKFRIVPERINTTNLLSGIYILEINGPDFRGVNKLIKF